MKKFWLISIFLLVSQINLAQPEILGDWTLHYMVIDGITYDVMQPHPSNPFYDPGIEFYEDGSDYQVTGFIHFNVFTELLPPIVIEATTFTVNEPTVTLGDCIPYCDLEGRYLGTILFGPAPRTFDYEITDGQNGNKTLTITTPEGNIAVHGNYVLTVDSFEKANVKLYPNPVESMLSIEHSNELRITKAKIISVVGENILEVFAENLKTLDLSFLETGLYFIELTSIEGERYVQKIIKA